MFVAMLVVGLWGAGNAGAHHKPDHTEGPPAATTTTVVTEDTDDDGVANAPDPFGDADNRHPSGNDKHVEAGGSGNQGWAMSEPDANGTGPERDMAGRDQPGGPGGMDVLDQDGNNGCGNDDDFEDDNEGWCGKPSEQPVVVTPPNEEETVAPAVTETPPGGTVPGEVLGEVEQAAGQPGAGVLGELGAGPASRAVGAAGLAPASPHHADADAVELPVQQDAAMAGALHHHAMDPSQRGRGPDVLAEEPPAPTGEPARQAGVMEQPLLAGHPPAVPAGHPGQAAGEAERPDPPSRARRVHHAKQLALLRGGRGCALENGRHHQGCGDAQGEGGPAPPPEGVRWPGRQTMDRSSKRPAQMQTRW
jgi:hypothetical protein